jgi:hypothetical protein
MRGIYLNTNSETLSRSIDFFAANNHIIKEQFLGNDVVLIYSNQDWQHAPVVQLDDTCGGGKVYCAGWFIYNGQRNNLTELANDYISRGLAVFDEIVLGVFVFIHIDSNGSSAICDSIGVSTHYGRSHEGQLQVAPSVKAFNDPGPVNPLMTQIIASQGHLFGNLTAYDSITRLDPGSRLSNDGSQDNYYAVNFNSPDKQQLGDISQQIKELIDYWPQASRTLALSGGLDSRLTLAGQRFAYGYTYGPEHSADRPIARQFADCFERYNEFEFTEPEQLVEEEALSKDFYFGVSTWIPRLLTAYHYSFERAQDSYVLFDGYLGDVFNRGNYMKFGGILGSLLKLCPWLYKLKLSAHFILKHRYKLLNEAAFKLLMTDFERRTAGLSADAYQKVTYYEVFYGRGARFTINGSNITAGQMFTPIPFFLHRKVMEMLLSQDFSDTVQYKLLGKIWSKVPSRFSEVESDTGYSPMTPYWLTPIKNMFHQLLSHYIPGRGNYATGQPKVSKKE